MSAWHARIGQRRWDLPTLAPDRAGWRAHRELLDAHLPFRDFELARRGLELLPEEPDGCYINRDGGWTSGASLKAFDGHIWHRNGDVWACGRGKRNEVA